MSKLISKKHGNAYANQDIVLPVVGEVKFDDKGAVDVAEDKVAELIAATVDAFDFHLEGSEPKAPAGKKDESQESKLTPEEIQEWKDLVSKASPEELLQMATEVKLGKPEKVAAYTDEKLRAEILKKVIGK